MDFIKRILVVDDEKEFVKTIVRHLKRESFSVDSARDGEDARQKIHDFFLKDSPFDLVITDMVMPNMDGIGLLEWIRKTHPEISVLVVTGFEETGMVSEAIRPELDDYCRKPLTPRQMMDLIASINRKRKNDTAN